MPKTLTAAEELREIRAALGLSQQAMAAAIGTSFRNYQRWEGGETRATAEALIEAYRLRNAKKKRRGA